MGKYDLNKIIIRSSEKNLSISRNYCNNAGKYPGQDSCPLAPGGENSFETGFGNVNIHQDDACATNMGVLHTQGSDIKFAPEGYTPYIKNKQKF